MADLGDPAGWIQSRHFLVTPLANDADTRGRAQAIAATCEEDLETLEKWFGCDFDGSPYGIIVCVFAGPHLGGGSNFGYNDDESSVINISGTYAPPGKPANPALRDEMARMVFVAELAEILMDFANIAWDRRNSMGEGLSLLAAETLHPTGYYATGMGPRIQNWLNGGRPDFITRSDGSDTNVMSYGCAVLFLNYLRYQLGFSFEEIVAGGVPFQIFLAPGGKLGLGHVFAQLTGRPSTSAYKEFTDLLQAHLPQGQPFTPLRDNLFPLRPAKQRSLSFSSADREMAAVIDPESLLILMKAGPMCEANVYSYHNVKVSSLLTLSGSTIGFAVPTFAWAVNGVSLPNSKAWQNTTVTLVATDTRPGLGEPSVAADLSIQFRVFSSGFKSTLYIRNANFPGNGALDISLSAVESLVAGDVATNFSDKPTLLTRRYSMGGAWARDVASCNIKDFGEASATLKTLVHRLVADENAPNPNPAVVRALATAARRYVSTLDAMTGGSRGLDSAVVNVFKELESVRAPLDPFTLNNSDTSLRILLNQTEVPRQLPSDASDDQRIVEANQSED
jgi:hypothetical protein